MSKCVQLAAEARSRFRDIVVDDSGRGEDLVPCDPASAVKIALSLGPFGAGLVPAQEFDGYYPPPFGPRGYTSGGENCNAFERNDGGRKNEDDATVALAEFHFERLCVFADDEATWAAIDFIAFETVPLLREIYAIRMAMATLEKRRAVRSKPWWISFVFPGGAFPESMDNAASSKIPVRSVVAAALEIPADSVASHLPSPSAIGINCTAMDAIPRILADMEKAVQEFRVHKETRPWLIVYPNGGDVYDPVSQTWVVKDKGGVWAEELGEMVGKAQSRGIWSGVVAGGCCRTGPEDIALLSKLHRQ
jgi:homocysteine S-methyltransferase